jgi:pimeloyl-ACP methyl ester carboxylesterase
MKKIPKIFLGFFKYLSLLFYGLIVVGLVITGFEVQRIEDDYGYVKTQYAKTIDVEGYTYFYREVGENNTETILMIHGFLGSSYDFIHVMDALKDRYHIIAVDLIGYGLSEKSLTFNYAKANQAAYLVKFLDALNINEVTVMAHSMGGEVSFHLAHDFPAYVNRMILIGSGGYVEPSNGNSLMPTDLPLFVYDYIAQNYFVQRTVFFTAYSNDEVQSQRVTQEDFDEMFIVNRTIPGKVLREFTLDNDSGSTNDKLKDVEQPILLIWGEFDGFIPLSTGQLLLAELGENADLVVMPNAGHLPFDTYFEDFMHHVEEFLI